MLAFGYLSLKAAIFLQVGVLALLKGLKHRHDEGKRVTDLTKPSRLAGVESYKYPFMVQVKIGIRKTCWNSVRTSLLIVSTRCAWTGLHLNAVKLIFAVEVKEVFTARGGFKRVQVSSRLVHLHLFREDCNCFLVHTRPQ